MQGPNPRGRSQRPNPLAEAESRRLLGTVGILRGTIMFEDLKDSKTVVVYDWFKMISMVIYWVILLCSLWFITGFS